MAMPRPALVQHRAWGVPEGKNEHNGYSVLWFDTEKKAARAETEMGRYAQACLAPDRIAQQHRAAELDGYAMGREASLDRPGLYATVTYV